MQPQASGCGIERSLTLQMALQGGIRQHPGGGKAGGKSKRLAKAGAQARAGDGQGPAGGRVGYARGNVFQTDVPGLWGHGPARAGGRILGGGQIIPVGASVVASGKVHDQIVDPHRTRRNHLDQQRQHPNRHLQPAGGQHGLVTETRGIGNGHRSHGQSKPGGKCYGHAAGNRHLPAQGVGERLFGEGFEPRWADDLPGGQGQGHGQDDEQPEQEGGQSRQAGAARNRSGVGWWRRHRYGDGSGLEADA